MASKRVLISIDERLLGRIDEACARNGIPRSTYLAKLAERDLHATPGPGGTATARAALTELDGLLRDET